MLTSSYSSDLQTDNKHQSANVDLLLLLLSSSSSAPRSDFLLPLRISCSIACSAFLHDDHVGDGDDVFMTTLVMIF